MTPVTRTRHGVAPVVWCFIVAVVGLLGLIMWQLESEKATQRRLVSGGGSGPMPVLLQLEQMIRSVRESSGVFYPVSGKWPQPPPPGPVVASGIGFLDASGAPVLYYLEEREQSLVSGRSALGRLLRYDVTSGAVDVVADGVREFVVVVPPHEPGQRITEVEVRVAMGDASAGPEARYETARKVLLRSERLGDIDWHVE